MLKSIAIVCISVLASICFNVFAGIEMPMFMANPVTITAGSVDGAPVGAVSPSTGRFTTVSTTSLSMTGQSNNLGIGAGLLTNGPIAGTPSFWLAVQINGQTKYIPAW